MFNIEKVLIVDDHPVVVEGVKMMIESLRPGVICQHSSNASDAADTLLRNRDIDCVFVDIGLPDINGFELLKRINLTKRRLKSVLLSSEIKPQDIDRALGMSVDGVLVKSFSRDQFEACLTSLEMGKRYLSEQHQLDLTMYRQRAQNSQIQLLNNISPRQTEILKMLAEGLSNKNVADRLKISESTVKSHVSALMDLLQADNRTHCVAKARDLGLLLH